MRLQRFSRRNEAVRQIEVRREFTEKKIGSKLDTVEVRLELTYSIRN